MLSIARITMTVLFVSLFAVVFTASSPSVCAQQECNDTLTVEVPEVPQHLMCGIVSQCTLFFGAHECTGDDPETVEVYTIGPFGFPTTPKVALGPGPSENTWVGEDECGDPNWAASEEVYFISDYGQHVPEELDDATIWWDHCE